MVSVLRKRGKNRQTHRATPTEVKRHKVLALLEYGIKPGAICGKMGYSPTLVRTVQKLRKAGQSLAPKCKGRSGRKRTKRTAEFLREIGHMFEEKPGQSFNKTALELGVSRRTVQQSAQELGFKSFQHRYRALLTTKTKIKRLERAEEILDWLAENPATVIIFR